MNLKYVYKRVRILSKDTYGSCSPASFKLMLNYRLGVWTKAFNGTPGIFVFPTLRRAKEFCASGLVLKCEYVGEPLRLTRRMEIHSKGRLFGYKSLVSIFSTPEKRKKMIESINISKFSRYDTSAPYETYVVNAVKPVEIAYPKKKDRLRMLFSAFSESVPFKIKFVLPDWMDNKWRIKR